MSRKAIDHKGDNAYGRFTFEGDADASERFRPDQLPDFTPVLQSLGLFTGKRIELEGSLIGRALQSPRRLAAGDPERIRGYLAAVASDGAHGDRLPDGPDAVSASPFVAASELDRA